MAAYVLMKPLVSELDYFIECLKELRRLRRDESLSAADEFKKEMAEYFRLPEDMQSVFVHDTLLRLAKTPAGSSSKRKDEALTAIHNMQKGDRFTLFGRPCLFRWHTGRREHPREGFFEYVYADYTTAYRSLDYNEAWHYVTEGDMVIDVLRT